MAQEHETEPVAVTQPAQKPDTDQNGEPHLAQEMATDQQAEKKATSKRKEKKNVSREADLEEVQRELKTNRDLYLRLRAEYDNYRKRSQTEKAAIYNNAISDAAMAILPVADNMERALNQENASVENLKKGLQMISNQFDSAFEALNIKPIGEKGEAFNPNWHNAVAHIEDDSVEEGIITEVLQKGYMIGDKVIRHAMVQVAN